MLDILEKLEQELPALLKEEDKWYTLYINYHPPFVERMWCDWGDYRVFLHCIQPCKQGEALFHPHPWPSAMKVLSGKYEMAVGYGEGDDAPPIAARFIINSGSSYEMTNINSWHDVRPIDGEAMSLMVAGKPWQRKSPGKKQNLGSLSKEQRQKVLDFFIKYYG